MITTTINMKMTMSNKKVKRGEVPHNQNIEKNHQDKKKNERK
jgi:hypothetical protein